MLKKESPLRRISLDFLVGAGAGIGLDVIFPLTSDGTYTNTLLEATAPLFGSQIFKYDSLKQRAWRGAIVYTGSIIGQTTYHLLKNKEVEPLGKFVIALCS